MNAGARLFPSVIAAAIVLCAVVPARAGSSALALKVSAIDRMMIDLAAESARDAQLIRRVYEEYLELLVLEDYPAIEGALLTGGLVPLPTDPRFNLAPRLDGAHPIGEKDLGNQASYVAARPATVGVLLEIASRVQASPVEITSLVRHGGYQDALRVTNANATTSVPMHTMGLAVDIALVNTPLATAYEIRDVLRDMRDAGDLLFIGERQQLVFHVVPHPSRIGYFTDVYTAALGAPASSRAIQVIAPAQPRRLEVDQLVPKVVAEVVSILPADASHWDEWFPAETSAVGVVARPPAAAPAAITTLSWAFGVLPMFGGILTAVVRRRRLNGCTLKQLS